MAHKRVKPHKKTRAKKQKPKAGKVRKLKALKRSMKKPAVKKVLKKRKPVQVESGKPSLPVREKQAMFEHPGSPIAGEAAFEERLAVFGTLDGTADASYTDEGMDLLENMLSKAEFNREEQEAKIKKSKKK